MIQIEQPFDQMFLAGIRSPLLKISDSAELIRILFEVSFGVRQNLLNSAIDLLSRLANRYICIEIAVEETDSYCVDKSLDF
ncbi:hypothetical protein BCCGELA001_25935 [Bradyrhizobium sp. CCGE-LA001]|nr:hypothetical protein BCCGELA001_25935 [Bradyrhizobium sp. CCGE-LA001]